MGVSKSRKICICILIIFLIFSSVVFFDFSNREKIEKEIVKISKDIIPKHNELKALEQEGKNYRLVTSADNVQVPVPKGYVASNITGENYVTPEYSHSTITHKVSTIPTELTWSSPEEEQYPWTQDENGIWISGNQGIPNSESVIESEEFDYVKGTRVTINFTYSSAYYDFLSIDLINLTNNTTQRIITDESGNLNSTFDYKTSNNEYTMNNWKSGRYKIRAKYSKNESGDGGKDSAYIKTSTYFKEDENGETLEEDIKTNIHDGGFVIYQLTDEELETDPNGTSVIINDSNKDEAQSTRNQYVWVPVPNIEDIVRTKEENNGIMQFGQPYIFSNISIIKETFLNPSCYKEPKLVENIDITKYNLQKQSNINIKRENYLNNMQEDFTRMIKSINKYKGFYIGRYETGDDKIHNYYNNFFKDPKIVRYNKNTNYISWYDSYEKLKRLSGKTEKSVETGMLYGGLWDYTLKWLNETDTRSYEEIAEDSGTWGNYANNYMLKYRESANGDVITKSIYDDWIVISTGGIIEIIDNGEIYSNFPTESNNIFDIAGNVGEWNRSRYMYSARVVSGGNAREDSKLEAASTIIGASPLGGDKRFGTRAQLYIL